MLKETMVAPRDPHSRVNSTLLTPIDIPSYFLYLLTICITGHCHHLLTSAMASSASQPVPTPALSEPQPSHPTPVINVIPAPPTDPPAAPAKKDPQFLAPVKPPSRKKRAGRDRNLVRKTRQKGTLDTRPPVYDGHWVHPHEARPEPHKRCFHDALRQLGHREEAPPHSVARRLRRDAHWLKFWSSPVDLLGKGQRQQALPDQGSDADAHGDTVEPEMEDGQRVLDEAIRERDEMSSRPHSAREKPMRYLFAKRAHRQREHAEASAAAAAAAATEAAVPQNSVEVPRSQQLRQTIICLRRESRKEWWQLVERLVGAKAC